MTGNPTRYYSEQQEQMVAKLTGGKCTANSGATAFYKGDVVTDDFLIECKTSIKSKDSFMIKEGWLEKNTEEAFAMRKNHSALCFDFGYNKNMRYYVISEREFLNYLNYVKENE